MVASSCDDVEAVGSESSRLSADIDVQRTAHSPTTTSLPTEVALPLILNRFALYIDTGKFV